MPSYAKFLKEILSNKRKLDDEEMVMLTEECSAILQKKLPPKLKDPGSFTIPCIIGNITFDRVLCDLGASINLMPFSVFRRLGIGEVKPTTMSLQLTDRSIQHLRAIVEDVLVKVGKIIFPADFVVLDMEEDKEIPLFPAETDSCFSVDVVDKLVEESMEENTPQLPLEVCIAKSKTIEVEESERNDCARMCKGDRLHVPFSTPAPIGKTRSKTSADKMDITTIGVRVGNSR
ncbi:uncharacterized protein LOC116116320 [Pistacia vera]|uniref:uncharacterized protein LOC116116320 n=1 Tax=Pistacia vera TaxID=55513 RepID=UPI0012635D4B|nr:uncharacterized protein LOC116116320 [Pistacia vera]